MSLTTALSEENIGEGYEYAKELFGVFYCEDTRVSCDISIVGENGDEDGDGIVDEEDFVFLHTILCKVISIMMVLVMPVTFAHLVPSK